MRKISTIDSNIKLAKFIAYNRNYAVEIRYVTEIIYYKSITPLPNAPRFIEGVIELRKKVLPVINLKKHLSIKKIGDKTKAEHILIVKIGGKRAGIIVDKVQTIVSVQRKSIQAKQEGNQDFLKGIFKYNGDIIMLLDIHHMLSKSELNILKDAV